MIKKYIGKGLVITGFVIIGVALFLKSYTAYRTDEIIRQYTKRTLGASDNHKALQDLQTSPPTLEPSIGEVIGILEIPKIDLEVALCEGTEKELIKYAVGHFEETALPGEIGNCSIIGHRNYTYGEFFNRLNEVEIGDMIKIKQVADEFVYKVTEIMIVEPEQVEVLSQSSKKEITLVTCTPINSGTHRLIVKGLLEE